MSCFRFDSMNKHGLSDWKLGFQKGWLDGADVFGQTVPFGKGTPLGVRRGRICNTALRIHVMVPRNCDK